jgi:menaquinone-dependent protoporphyrinogen IX oxidase
MYSLPALIAIYASDRGLPDFKIRELLDSGDITWQDLQLAVITFSIKISMNPKSVQDFVKPQRAKKRKEKVQRISTLLVRLKNEKDDNEKLKIEKEIDKVQFNCTREEMVARANKIKDEIVFKERGVQNCE